MKSMYNYLLLAGFFSCFLTACTSPQLPQAYSLKQTEETLQLFVKERPVLSYHISTVEPPDSVPPYYRRSGHVHPLYTPSGTVLTDGFPVGHTHQHGLFMTWVNTTFKGEKVDFWNQHEKLGTVRHKAVKNTFEKEGSTGFTVELEHVSLAHGPALLEERSYEVSAEDGVFILDVLSKQSCASTDTLFLNKYHYGGFAFRGNGQWNEEDPTISDSMQILTSEGKVRHEANHTRPDWVAAYGKVDGKMVSVAIMGHPDNFRFPQPVRAHPKMPYFVFSPTELGPFEIVPGEVYTSAYRVLTFDGPPDAERIEGMWEAYRAGL